MQIQQIGIIKEIRDGIALIEGLPEVLTEEFLFFYPRAKGDEPLHGMALGFDEKVVKAIIFGDFTRLHHGDEVRPAGHILQIPVGAAFLGRVVSPLGLALDGKSAITNALEQAPVEREALGIVDRDPVEEPMLCGIKTIDAMIPVGRGQRELIIGDRKLGKTSIALDAIINQRLTTSNKRRVVC